MGPAAPLHRGDILLLSSGTAHSLHDGSGAPPMPAYNRPGLNLVFSENGGTGERLDMLCGHFITSPEHNRLFRTYLPPLLIVRGARGLSVAGQTAASAQVSGLIALMRPNGAGKSRRPRHAERASSALFTWPSACSEAAEAPAGLLALAGHPRLAPAMTAMFQSRLTPGHCRSLLACATCRGRRSRVISRRAWAAPPPSCCWTSA